VNIILGENNYGHSRGIITSLEFGLKKKAAYLMEFGRFFYKIHQLTSSAVSALAVVRILGTKIQ
jgi:hypothetical protein